MQTSEFTEHIKLMTWIRAHKDISPYVIHIANERQCSPMHGAMLKRMGVKAGVPDLFFFIPANGYHGLWIELKKTNGQISKEQRIFLHDAKSMGYSAKVCYGAKDAAIAIKEYFDGIIEFVPFLERPVFQ